jgi:carbon-monoxide dehydrogenase medium subunit
VKPAPFAYKKVRTLKEAVTLLAKHKDNARLLAGGQSLIATLNMRLSAPSLLIDINGIEGLDGIAKKGKFVEVGALARHAQVERSDVIARYAPLIALAMPHIGHAAIRNRGSFGGSIAFADPAAELPACLLAMGGEVDLASAKGNRKVKVKKAEAALADGNVDGAVNALDLDPHDDVQATAKVKKHLAGVLLRRVAAQLLETRP